jgi:hypothetical protein
MPLKRKNSIAAKPGDTQLVEDHLKKLKHPLKNEIETVREIIKKIDKHINERIKWNAPSYYIKKENTEVDFLTFNHYKDKVLLLVFHHPTIVKIKSNLLKGEYKDRRLIYFENMKEINANKKELIRIIDELLKLIK